MITALLLVIKATLLLLAALGLDTALRRRHVLACSAMWNASLVALLALPVMAMSLPTIRLPVFVLSADSSSSLDNLMPASGSVPSTRSLSSAESSAAVAMNEPSPSPFPSTYPVSAADERNAQLASSDWRLGLIGFAVAIVYGLGVCIFLIRLCTSLIAAARLQSATEPVDSSAWTERFSALRSKLGLDRRVKLTQSDEVIVPIAVGFFRPLIVLPRDLVEKSEATRSDAILVHELAHVLRGDYAWEIVLRILQAVLWFHPLIWLAGGRISFARERACDDFAIHVLGSHDDYANALLFIAGRLTKRPALSLGLAVLRNPRIAARLEAIVASNGNPLCRLSAVAGATILAMVLAMVGLLGSVTIAQGEEPDRKGRTEPSGSTVGPPANNENVVVGQPKGDEGRDPSIRGAAVKTFAVDQASVRQAWQNRSDEQAGIVYQATAVTSAPSQERTDDAARSVSIDALMRCDERKFRFDVKANADRYAALHILDSGGLHTCRQTLPTRWDATSAHSISEDSPWLNLYPFLLAHGVVPLPPLDAPPLSARKPQEKRPGGVVAGQRATFEFPGKEPISVSVSHEAHGLIERYEVTRSGKKLLEIRNTYVRQHRVLRLDGFTVKRFDASGKLTGQLNGRVKVCRLDAQIPLAAFALPRNPDAVRAGLLQAFTKTALVKADMSLSDLAQSVQTAVGKDVQVRIDAEAFANAPQAAAVNVDRLRLQAGEATLSQILLRDLRRSRVDFYVDAQGIVLIPRNEAWNYAGFVNYSAKDYGVTTGELRNLIFNAGTPDDWSDFGGQATIVEDKDGQTLMVLHTPSDHLRFEEQLQLRKGGD